MLYFLLHIVSNTLFSLGYKVAEHRRDCYTPAIHLAIFVTATAGSAVLAIVHEGFVADPRCMALGAFGGISLLVAVRTFFVAMAQGGLAVGWTFVNMGIVIPVIASIWLWDEIPTFLQGMGMALVVPCVVLFGDLRMQVAGDHGRWLRLVTLATVATGLTQTVNKAASVLSESYASQGAVPPVFNFLTWMFACGAVGLLLLGEGKHWRIRSAETGIGAVMGVLSIAAVGTLLKTLTVWPGIVVFPMKAVCGVVLTAVCAVVFFRERLTHRQAAGILVGAIAVALVNIH